MNIGNQTNARDSEDENSTLHSTNRPQFALILRVYREEKRGGGGFKMAPLCCIRIAIAVILYATHWPAVCTTVSIHQQSMKLVTQPHPFSVYTLCKNDGSGDSCSSNSPYLVIAVRAGGTPNKQIASGPKTPIIITAWALVLLRHLIEY